MNSRNDKAKSFNWPINKQDMASQKFPSCIMQIVCSGKVSRLHDLVIRGKTFAIAQQFDTPYNKKEKIR